MLTTSRSLTINIKLSHLFNKFDKWEMVSELLCTTHKNANNLACSRLWMRRKANTMSGGCLINVVCVRLRCPCRPRYLGWPECKTPMQSEFCTWQNSVRGARAPENVYILYTCLTTRRRPPPKHSRSLAFIACATWCLQADFRASWRQRVRSSLAKTKV